MNKAVPVELTLSISAMIIAVASITISIWEGVQLTGLWFHLFRLMRNLKKYYK